ncbi:MAG: hypothetical protein A2W22_00075, partial [Candidatus Levybacteria bacterium RBG_16_35_11]
MVDLEYNLISHSLHTPLRLCDHLNQVSKASKYLISQKNLCFNGISKNQIEELIILIAVCHDFGKSTYFFQEYIKSKINGTKYVGTEKEKSHSLLSAFFGWNMAEKWVLKNPQLDEHWKSFLPFAVFMGIQGHHGEYKSIDEILKTIATNLDLLKKQIENVNPEIYNYELFNVKLSEGKDIDINVLDSIYGKLTKLYRKYEKMELDYQIEQRILALLLYSILLESDKAYLASDKPEQYERNPINIPDNLVDIYIKGLGKNKSIDDERNKAYKETIECVNTFPLNERLHSITLPTGLGKTLLSASWALKLRNRIEGKQGFTPKIIVSLPFLSIIEQTDKNYKDFLGDIYEKHKDRLYLPRYSIADFKYKDGLDNEERSDNSVDFFLNIWNSEIVVSTFDQLLYSLFSLKSKHLMRFHNLFNSIIIFDEIHALPSELWKSFEFFFKKLSEVGNTHILLMSATQPGFFPGVIERVPNHEDYFKNRKRIKLTIKPEKKSIENFMEELPVILNKHSDKSVMIVLNTRDSSKTIYKKIRDLIDDKIISERPKIYLSSHVAPSQRSERILKINDCIRNRKNPVIVTTQCIEAGVDIDVDYIIRDWAPLDSIFQVCGRCNRNGEKKEGVVEIVKLESDKKLFSEMVYDDILLGCTSFSVAGNLEIFEEKFYQFGFRYFESVRGQLGQSMKILKSYADFSYKYNEKTVNIKKLLRGDEHQEHFIISSLDIKLPDDIKEALSKEDRWERRYAVKKLSKRIAANSVSVRYEKWMPYKPEDLEINQKIGYFRILDEKFYNRDDVGLDV